MLKLFIPFQGEITQSLLLLLLLIHRRLLLQSSTIFYFRMAEGHDKEEMKLENTASRVDETKDLPRDDAKDDDNENQMPSKEQEEELVKKKYGGLLPKKPPLISKDSERAFFDSADWALGKKSKGPLEALRPKLQPTPHPQVRSPSAYARADDGEDGCNADENNDDPSPDGDVGNSLDGSGDECSNCHSSENHQNQQK